MLGETPKRRDGYRQSTTPALTVRSGECQPFSHCGSRASSCSVSAEAAAPADGRAAKPDTGGCAHNGDGSDNQVSADLADWQALL